MGFQARSSREFSASAVERDRKAREDAELRCSLQAQIAALSEQVKAAEESEKQHREQAEADRQAAIQLSFHEISLAKQEEFRLNIAPEVYNRVGNMLESDEDRDYVKAIAEGHQELENPLDFKVMLWDAIAGGDVSFFRVAAQGVYKASIRNINEADVANIKSSNVCLRAVRLTLQNGNKDATGHLVRHSSEPVTAIASVASFSTIPRCSAPENQQLDEMPQSDATDAMDTSITTNHTSNDDAERLLKQEKSPEKSFVNRRRHMLEIDQDGDSTVESQTSDTTNDRVSSRQNSLDHLKDSLIDSVELRRTPVSPKATSTSTKRKRVPEDNKNANRVASSPNSTPKKAKVPKALDGSTASKFESHVVELARAGNLSSIEFGCSKCGKDMTDSRSQPRMASKCHHLYCYKCFQDIRQSLSGNDRKKAVCVHTGCGKATGTASIISADEVNETKKMYNTSLGVVGGENSGSASRFSDERGAEETTEGEGSDSD